MSPTFDLSVIGRSNELDGDPDRLDSMVRVMRTNADAISDANANIRKLTQQGNEMESKAFAALGNKAREIDDGLQQTAMRYRLMATAVSEFSSVLRDEQSLARQRLEAAMQAKQEHARAAADHSVAQNLARSVDEGTRQQGIDLATSASARSQSASSTLQSNSGALHAAIDRVHSANVRAADKVQGAMESSGLDDSFIDKVMHVGKKIADALVEFGKWIWDNLEAIAMVVQIIAWVAPFIPVIGPFIAGAAGGLLAVLKVAMTIKRTLKTAETIWSVAVDISEGDYAGATKTALTFGANYVVGKVIGKATSVVSKTIGESVSKRMYSLGADGSLQSTEAGRQLHQVVMKFGPAMIAEGDPLPPDFASMHINRTQQIIQDGTEYVVSRVTKAGLKSYYEQNYKQSVDSGIEAISGLFDGPETGRCYDVSTSPEPARFSGGGGGGGGGRGW